MQLLRSSRRNKDRPHRPRNRIENETVRIPARERAARVRPQHICSTPGRVSRLTDQVKRRGHNALVVRVLAHGRRNRKRVVMRPRRSRPAAEGDTCGPERRPVDTPHRSALARPVIALSAVPNVSSAFSNLAAHQSVNPRVTATGQRPPRSRQTRSQRGLHRRQRQLGETGGSAVGPTRRRKGSTIMAIGDRHGLPVAIDVASASPHEVALVDATLAAPPQRAPGAADR